jgi:hypothetical protein
MQLNKAFISYSFKDKELAKKIVGDLQRNDIAIWFDQFEIDPGENFISKLSSALKECGTLCIIHTRNMLKNNGAAKEEWSNYLAMAMKNKKRKIIPLIFDNSSLPAILSARSYIDMRNYDDGLKKLISFLNKLYVYGFLKDFTRPQMNRFSGGMGGGEATVFFDPQISGEIRLQISLGHNDAFAGIYFKSHDPIDLTHKKYLCLNIKGIPAGNIIEIKLGYPEKAYYLKKIGNQFEEIAIPLSCYNQLDHNKVEILTIAMNDSHFMNKSKNGNNIQELYFREIHFK